MTFTESISTCLSKYADFNGRASRSEYWWFQLFFILSNAAGTVISEKLGILVMLGLFLPAIASCTRRLHDTNRSGWMQLLSCIPLVNLYVLYLLIKEGEDQGNRF